jgi:hypothetical protein
MPKKLTKEEAQKLRATKKRGAKKEIIFGAEIDALKKGEELFISEKEWKVKTSLTSYYYGKYAKGVEKKDRKITYEKVEGGLLITKL